MVTLVSSMFPLVLLQLEKFVYQKSGEDPQQKRRLQ